MNDEQKQPEPTFEELERLHNAVVAIELQLQDIANHYPQLLGMALLSMSTFMVEKVYTCSDGVESANLLLAAAQETGLQNWIDQVERERDPPVIVTPS